MNLSDENEDGERLLHKGASACLHCLIWEAIMAYHDEAGLIENGQFQYDTRIILGNLGDVLAEIAAAAPDRNERRKIMRAFDDHVREKTAEYIASGRHPESRAVRVQ